MEDWTAEADEPRRFSVERIEGCDLCVLLVAWRRGFIPPGETHSITQLEYENAIARGIDVLVFLLDEDAPWPPRFVALDDALKRWREELSVRHGRGLFRLEPSSIPLGAALTRWVTGRQRKVVEVGSDWVQLVSNVLGLSKNEPETWTVAAKLLPHALAAVEREYFGAAAMQSGTTAPGPTPVPPTRAFRALLADTPTYLQTSPAQYERSCYVILPFGMKTTNDGETVDFDRVYGDVFVPAIEAVSLADGGSLEPVRADTDLLSGGMSQQLLRYLEYSRLVLADITTPNANVFYELGRRHRARETGTIIVAQARAQIPFDLNSMRVLRYSCESPANVMESRALLSAALRTTLDVSAGSTF